MEEESEMKQSEAEIGRVRPSSEKENTEEDKEVISVEVVRAFVKGCIVFASIKVIEKERKKHIRAFGERKQWSSKKGYFFSPTLDPNVEAMKGEKGEDDPAATPPISEDSKSDEGDNEEGNNEVEEDFNLVGPMQSTNSVSIHDLYGDTTMSPIQMYSTHLGSNKGGGSEIEGDQENFWKVIDRVFRAPKSKAYIQPEIVVEEEIKKVVKVYVEPRIKYQWQERITWLDEIIKIANDNYGGSDGGFSREIPTLIKSSKVYRADIVTDSQKRGTSWSAKRLQSAVEFEKKIFDPDVTLQSVQAKLFKTGTDA
ncbi:hypothetical protein TL16_g10138 [Triparma laevis f. inornata]|uniref:Uncharacterized protein n=1 Tax=Triparma laevis f. inornata TaxID=1714386 RepID=A0A9W7BAQ1_9STRA|nr:hypothetical protein TL16_g10138 [Triparma laevis f. inornata]